MSAMTLHYALPTGGSVELTGGSVVYYLPNATRPIFSGEIGELEERAPDLLAYLLEEGIIHKTE